MAWQHWVDTVVYMQQKPEQSRPPASTGLLSNSHCYWNTLIYCKNVIYVVSHDEWFYQVCLCDFAGGPGVSWQDGGVYRQGWIRPLRCEYRVLLSLIKVQRHLLDYTAFICYVSIFEIILRPDYAVGPLQNMKWLSWMHHPCSRVFNFLTVGHLVKRASLTYSTATNDKQSNKRSRNNTTVIWG